MKKITLNLVKGLLVIVLFTGVSVALSTTGVQPVSEVKAGGGSGAGGSSAGSSQGGVIASTVNQYLVNHAYSNIQSISVSSSSSSGTTWRATVYSSASGTQVSVSVYVQGSQIVANTENAL